MRILIPSSQEAFDNLRANGIFELSFPTIHFTQIPKAVASFSGANRDKNVTFLCNTPFILDCLAPEYLFIVDADGRATPFMEYLDFKKQLEFLYPGELLLNHDSFFKKGEPLS